MLRFHGVVVAGGIVAAAFSGASALADSRIFTVKASEPGVTIEQAFRNGKELAVAGRGDGTTLFRIDEPSTIVACANRFDFVTSTGEKVNLAADMCVLNWEVTVDVAAAPATPPPAAAAEPTPPAEPAPPASPPPPATAAAPDVPDIPAVPEVPDDTAAPATTTPVAPAAFSQVVTVCRRRSRRHHYRPDPRWRAGDDHRPRAGERAVRDLRAASRASSASAISASPFPTAGR